MLTQLLWALVTALLSSAATALALWWVFDKRIRPGLERDVDAKLAEALEELGTTVETKVRQGVLDGVSSIPSPEVLRDTTRTVARTGVALAEEGLKTLLGGPRPRRRDR